MRGLTPRCSSSAASTMKLRVSSLSLLLLLPIFVTVNADVVNTVNRKDFPDGFLFGAGSSAYQYEGAAREGGKGPSIWDTFTHDHPEKIADKSNGDVAEDQYHRYKEDVSIMKDIGFNAYRFSISWSRILPNGSISGGINKEGVQYYNNLINELASKGMKSFVTLFHWDVPQGLEDQYGGFLSNKLVKDYVDYADLCFKLFGDRVKHWATFNEPRIFCMIGYAYGLNAPGRCSPPDGACIKGDSSREPYLACHNLLLAHSAAVELYKTKYQKIQKGKIGITLDSNWMLPYSNKTSDIASVQRALDFEFGWFMDPLNKGDYPSTMKTLVKERLPQFSTDQSQKLKGSYDFVGINYYTSDYTYNVPKSNDVNATFSTDPLLTHTSVRNGVPIGPKTDASLFYIYPEGLRHLLVYTKTKYNNPTLYITENGVAHGSNTTATIKEILNDDVRSQFYNDHLFHVQRAIRDGANVRGFFAWSLFDDFEWSSGYTIRFGLIHVDLKNGLKRYPKNSALWFQKFLKT